MSDLDRQEREERLTKALKGKARVDAALADRGQEYDAPVRCCDGCGLPIPDGEKAIEAKTGNGWKHFECWYDGGPFPRDPETGARAMSGQEREALLEEGLRWALTTIENMAGPAKEWPAFDKAQAALVAREDTERPAEEDERAEVELRNFAEAVHRLNVDWEGAAHACGDATCKGDCRYVREVQETLDRVLGTERVRDIKQEPER